MRIIVLIIFLFIAILAGGLVFYVSSVDLAMAPVPIAQERSRTPIPSSSRTPTPALLKPPVSKTLPNDYHTFQTFNNCGPAAFSMALSYYGINRTQQELGQALRPYQIPGGNNDDKSVTLRELAEKSKEYGFVPYHRPNGNIESIKLFITYNIPVITRTWLKENEDIGHYRVIKGYDSSTGEIIQDDSLQGKNLRYSYDQFLTLWKKFNYEYLVLVPEEKIPIATLILGEDADELVSWSKAVANAQEEVSKNPADLYSRFNLSVALYHTGDYQQAVEVFETVEQRLPFRTLWYQIEPIQSYYELNKYDRVFEITDRILNYYNRAFSELYLIRGEIYKKQGNVQKARQEFENAVRYNANLPSAHSALNALR